MNLVFTKLDNTGNLKHSTLKELGELFRAFCAYKGIDVGEWIEDFILDYSPLREEYSVILYQPKNSISGIRQICSILRKLGSKPRLESGGNKFQYSPDGSKGHTIVGYKIVIPGE